MMLDRVCRECGKHFEGGPRAYYCPECRHKRQLARQAGYRVHGYVRPLGSTDMCKRCGKPYTVTAGTQKYCPECQPTHSREYDRETGLKYYHEHADQINPPRNEKRRVGLTKCVICGKEFDANHTCRNTCSEKCKLALIKQNQHRADAKRSPRKKGIRTSDK